MANGVPTVTELTFLVGGASAFRGLEGIPGRMMGGGVLSTVLQSPECHLPRPFWFSSADVKSNRRGPRRSYSPLEGSTFCVHHLQRRGIWEDFILFLILPPFHSCQNFLL